MVSSSYDCIKAFSETEFTEDIKKIDIPCFAGARRRRPDRSDWASALQSSQAAPARYAEGISRLPTRNGHHPRRRHFINADLLAFFRESAASATAWQRR